MAAAAAGVGSAPSSSGAGAAAAAAAAAVGGGGGAAASGGWRLPGRVLEFVFSYLELRELCALVCKMWYRVLHGDENSEVWRSLAARSLAEEALRTDILCNVPTYKGKVRPGWRPREGDPAVHAPLSFRRYVPFSMLSAPMIVLEMSILRRMGLLCTGIPLLRVQMAQEPRLALVKVAMPGKSGGKVLLAQWQ
ncbi:hypothetical protein JRQ81_014284 [Phrynocephalus forsythii]|uniref:F-box domain-containing protein n=1 Tax=Phrynocephalus forsythii TaxID=171643 RepID=A0A9Q0XWG0_9SAUR|nr:hypothetical protein JRQ81_014284 [Phrynocephalus forsythii]